MENRIINILRQFPFDFIVTWVSTMKILYSILYTHEQKTCVLHCPSYLSYGRQIKLTSVSQTKGSANGAAIGLAACESCSCCGTFRIVSTVSEQELQSHLMICSPSVKHVCELKEVICNTLSNVVKWVLGLFPEVQRPGLGFEHPPPTSPVVKERVELYHYSPSEP
jgi:hypothetical protein